MQVLRIPSRRPSTQSPGLPGPAHSPRDMQRRLDQQLDIVKSINKRSPEIRHSFGVGSSVARERFTAHYHQLRKPDELLR
eukprot:COSAG02_NODE_415_length_22762_cov_133.681816_19_plen_80_part_00